LDCTEQLSLGMVKDMICVPVILSLRSVVKHEFDKAWLALSSSDTETAEFAARKLSTAQSRAADPDDMKITFKIFYKILTQTSFQKYFLTKSVFGMKGNCSIEYVYL
jgi:hypothetical protein